MRPTTIRSTSAALLLLVGGGAFAEEPLTEGEIVSRYLAGPTVAADLETWRARARAAGTVAVDVASPEIAYRHEDAAGPAGARTDAIGASLTLDLGLNLGARRASASARADSIRASREAALLDAVCSVRGDVGALESVGRELTVRREAQGRLDELATALAELARAGEASGYDGDRATLAASAHRLGLLEASGREETLRASLTRRVGSPVGGVRLLPIGDTGDLDGYLERGAASYPELVALRHRRDAARRQQRAARGSAAPDLTLSGGARFDAPPEGGPASPGFEVGVAVELPVTGRARADIEAASADLYAAEAELLRAEQAVAASIDAAWRRALAAASIGVPDVDPAAIWAAARARYAGGEASIDELLQTARDVEEAELATLGVARRSRQSRLDLQCAVGAFDDPTIQSAFEEALR